VAVANNAARSCFENGNCIAGAGGGGGGGAIAIAGGGVGLANLVTCSLTNAS